jgi:hypothetical protein
MRPKRVIAYLGFVVFGISITGCVYLRLLEVKRQLSNFEDYFKIGNQHELTLICLKPVLLPEDVIWLTKLNPTSKEQTDQGELWRYIFEKRYSGPKNEDGNFDMPVSMLFLNGKLREVRLPERFSKVVSKALLIKMFKSMGSAKVSELRGSASSRFEGKDSLEIPTEQFVIRVLGKPFDIEDFEHTLKFIYRYDLKRTEPGQNSEDSELRTRFTFQRGEERLLKAEGKFSRFNMSMDFSVDGNDPKK